MATRNRKKKIRVRSDEKSVNSLISQIIKIRKEENLTQKELGEKLGVSDRTISAWETGTATPDSNSIIKICTELGISPSAFVLQKKTFKDYLNSILKLLAKCWNFVWTHILMIIFSILFILLFIFWVNNYNAINVYYLNYNGSDNITIDRGYFIKNKTRNILVIDNISVTKIDYDIKSVNLELYTLVNADRITLYTANNLDDIVIDELNNYPTVLKRDIVRSMQNNLHLKITIIDEDDEIHNYQANIVFKEFFSNDKLAYPTYQSETSNNSSIYASNNVIPTYNYRMNQNISLINYSEAAVNIEPNNTKIINKEKLQTIGYEYNEDTNTYIKQDGIKEIEYNDDADSLTVRYVIDDYEYITYFYVSSDRILFNLNVDGQLAIKINYYVSISKLNCMVGNCENYTSEIDYILAEYDKIFETLF